MSLTAQLKALAIPITTSYATDNVKRRSLIYDDPSKVDTQSCYQQNLICCIIPYHETGLFAKFVQLVNYHSISSDFLWLKEYAESGRNISRQEFTRLCIHERSLIPFMCTSILKFIEFHSDTSTILLNDVTNFFLSTITALCDSGAPEKKLVEILDSFQGVITRGLKSMNVVPFQCATFLVILRFNLKLSINHGLILDWISCILRHTNSGKEWESVRLIIQLMRNQNLSILPLKLANQFEILMSKLSTTERQFIEKEEATLVDNVDANELAEICSKKFPNVYNATQNIDLDLSSSRAVELPSNEQDSLECTEHKKLAVDELHAFLASIPDVGLCVMNDPNCVCPKVPIVKTEQWLSNVMYALFPASSYSKSALQLKCRKKKKICQDLQCLNYFKLAVSLVSKCSQCKFTTRAHKSPKNSSSNSLLMKGIDHALPLLVACLSHSVPVIRIEAYDILASCLKELINNSIGYEKFLNINLFLNSFKWTSELVKELDKVFSDEIKDLLRGDSLELLGKAAPNLINACARLLFSQSLDFGVEETLLAYSSICWFHALRLLNEYTVYQLFSTNNSFSSTRPSCAWPALLKLIRSPQEPFTNLHELCLSRFTESVFKNLSFIASPDQYNPTVLVSLTNQSFAKCGHQNLLKSNLTFGYQIQTQFLDAISDLGHLDLSSMTPLEQLLSRLHLDATHFDYMLIKSDSWKSVDNSSKSLFARISEARKIRRCSSRGCALDAEDGSVALISDRHVSVYDNRFESIRLRFISVLLSVLTESVPRLQKKEIAMFSNHGKAVDVNSSDPSSGKTANRLSMLTEIPVHDLITPLINHLVSILNKEQHLNKTNPCINQIDNLDSSDSSGNDDDDDNDNDNDTGIEMQTTSRMDKFNLSVTINSTGMDNLTAIRALLRQCVYRLLVCMTTILTEGNRSRRPRKKRWMKQMKSGLHPFGLLCEQTSVQAAVDPVFLCLTVYPDWVALHQEILLCFIELSTMFPQVLCQRLVSLVQWVACSNQLMRLDNSHNLSLLGRLIVVAVPALIRASSDQITASLDVLSLFVNQFPVFPTRLNRRRLALYTGLVRGLAQVTGPVGQFKEAICSGKLERGSRKRYLENESICQSKANWLGSWLWVTSVIFLNKNWDEQTTAEQVGSFLVDLFNQFSWDNQIFSWCECITFLIFISNHCTSDGLDGEDDDCNCNNQSFGQHYQTIMNSKNNDTNSIDELNYPSKRRRLMCTSATNISKSEQINDHDPKQSLLVSLKNMNIILSDDVKSLIRFVFNIEVNQNSGTKFRTNDLNLWSLISRCVELLSTLILNPTYADQIHLASDDPLGLGVVYGLLVQRIVKLMLSTGTIIVKHRKSFQKDGVAILNFANESISCLNSILLQILDSVPGHVFISMVSDLFNSTERGLRRKSLELLATKLSALTDNLPPTPIIMNLNKLNYEKIIKRQRRNTSRHIVGMELSMESGLIYLTGRLVSIFDLGTHLSSGSDRKNVKSTLFGSSSFRQSLYCLKCMCKLLANRYPGEFMGTMDILIANSNHWWPSKPQILSESGSKVQVRGTSLAESRSLVSLFFVECLQHLPSQSLYPEASATLDRLTWLVQFALDHAVTSTYLSASPTLSVSVESAQTLTVGLLQSRDQHLQASLTLIVNLLELAIVHRLFQQHQHNTILSSNNISGSLVGQWLQFDFAKNSHQIIDNLTSTIMLRLVFQFSQLDLAQVTGSNPERSATVLQEITGLLTRIRKLYPRVTDLKHLLLLVLHIIETNMHKNNLHILNGALSFLNEFGASVVPLKNDGNLTEGDKLEIHEFTILNSSNPDILPHLLTSMLNASAIVEDSELHTNTVCFAVSSLICTLNSGSRLKLCQSMFDWLTSSASKDNFIEKIRRLSIVFQIIKRIYNHLDAEEYSELSKNLSVIDYIVFTFNVAIGYKQKDLKKLARRLNLLDMLQYPIESVPRSDLLKCVHSALGCLNQWLICETQCNVCLDCTASGESVLAIPHTLISLLQIPSSKPMDMSIDPPLIETDLQDVLLSFLKAVSADEAFVRPLGSVLAHQIMHAKHWRTRLASIRLIKFIFEKLHSTNSTSGDLVESELQGSTNCLISDTLAALSEALEDSQPEVEVEANTLFAKLDQMGLTVNGRGINSGATAENQHLMTE